VTIGMDMANDVAVRLGLTPPSVRDRMRPLLARNASEFSYSPVDIDLFIQAFRRDKKHKSDAYVLVLPDAHGRIALQTIADRIQVEHASRGYLQTRPWGRS
jgi:3-dehydroquinate synthase